MFVVSRTNHLSNARVVVAYVVGYHDMVAAVNLESLAVTHHAVPGLMHAHLRVLPAEGEGSAGALHNIYRHAARFGPGTLLVSGGESDPVKGKDEIRYVTRDASLVDLHTWRIARVFADIPDVQRLNGLDFGGYVSPGSRSGSPTALRVFGQAGQLRYRIDLRPAKIWRLLDGRLLVGDSLVPSAAVVRNPETGKQIGKVTGASKWWGRFVVWRPST